MYTNIKIRREFSHVLCMVRTKSAKVPGSDLFSWCESNLANSGSSPKPHRRSGLGSLQMVQILLVIETKHVSPC